MTQTFHALPFHVQNTWSSVWLTLIFIGNTNDTQSADMNKNHGLFGLSLVIELSTLVVGGMLE